jgi:predicted nucleotidyltransferase
MFFPEQSRIIRELLQAGVDFMVIGGYAVIYHGYARGTGDLDIWLRPDSRNNQTFIEALENYGIEPGDIRRITETDFSQANAFHIGSAPDRVDFLTKIGGLNYGECEKRKKFIDLEGRQVPVINLEDLIVNKLLSGRMKDKADVEELQRLMKSRNETKQNENS